MRFEVARPGSLTLFTSEHFDGSSRAGERKEPLELLEGR
jgi:hypothetical protein